MEVVEAEFDPMDLLAPEVCINETDPFLTYNDNEAEKKQTEINHNDDIQEIIDVDDESEETTTTVNGFNHDADAINNTLKPGQLPEPYSEEEKAVYSTIYGEGNQSVQFHRLHCTACNAHLGSAPYKQHDRYVHPLLKVLICKSCFDFYGSGDFEKDEDGSELYCRWCGQGGKVLCCARCPCVFCQKCIRVNQGKKALESVLQSDDWLCFVCNPQQIIRQRITSRALYDYVQNELTTWRPLNRPDILDIDKSMCCKAKNIVTPKRKPLDENFTPKNEKKIKKKKFCINPLSKGVIAKKSTNDKSVNEQNVVTDWEAHPEDEVVCTPDLMMIMNFDEGAESVTMEKEPDEEEHESEAVSVVTPVNVIEETSNSSKSKSPSSKKYKAGPKSEKMKKKGLKKNNQKTNQEMLRSLPDLMPGSFEWFDKTTQATVEINKNLSTTICSLSDKQESITTVESLVKVHNDLQEMLGNVVQSITKIRKDLRADFIANLKSLKFIIRNTNASESEVNQDDNDVIIIDSNFTEPDVQPALVSNAFGTTTEVLPAGRTHGYIKVKPPSELLQSSLILVQKKSSLEEVTNTEQTTSTLQKLLDEPTDSRVNKKKSFETSVNKQLKSIRSSIPEDLLKQMATVKVVLDKKLEVNSVKSHSWKGYIPFKFNQVEENSTERNESQKKLAAIRLGESSSSTKIDLEEKIAEKKQINGIVNDHVVIGNST